MPTPKKIDLKARLARYRQIKISVIGRKSGRIRRRFRMRTKNSAATEIAQKFVKAINAHDADGLTKLMSSDHVFVDSLGNRFPASAMRSGWQEYFAMVPDYWIKVDQIVSEEDAVILFGSRRRDLRREGRDDETRKRMGDPGGVAGACQRWKSRRVARLLRQRADKR